MQDEGGDYAMDRQYHGPILQEIKRKDQALNNHKAPGEYYIAVELLKYLG